MYYYDQQIKKYIIQFMAIFSNFQVKVGKSETEEERLISVPVYYGNRDRVVAHILSDNTQNKLLRLPAFSAYLMNFDLAPDRRRGPGTTNRKAFVPQGGLVPDDIKVVTNYMSVPYWANFELMIYTSNTDQHTQLLEQILSIFEPLLQIQRSDGVFDPTKIAMVELTGINNQNNYPPGADRRIIQTQLTFKVNIEMSIPAEVRKQFVETVLARIGELDVILESTDSQEIIATLAKLNINYEVFATGKDVNFK